MTRIFSLVLLFAAGSITTSGSAQAQNVGDSAPDFTFSTSNGAAISLSSYRGRTVLLYIFGNKCPFCIQSGPQLESQINQVYSPTGKFVAIGLDTWPNSTALTVDAFKAQTGITFPLLLNAAAIERTYSTVYDRLIVVDKDGIIRYKGGSRVSNTLDAAKSIIGDLVSAGSTDIDDESGQHPFSITQNYPNPFSARTEIGYSISVDRDVTLTVYDLLGQVVEVLVDSRQSAGSHTVGWDGTDRSGQLVASGTYFYSLRAGNQIRTKSVAVVR